MPVPMSRSAEEVCAQSKGKPDARRDRNHRGEGVPATLYSLVSDLPRTGEWSPECTKVTWSSAWRARLRGPRPSPPAVASASSPAASGLLGPDAHPAADAPADPAASAHAHPAVGAPTHPAAGPRTHPAAGAPVHPAAGPR